MLSEAKHLTVAFVARKHLSGRQSRIWEVLRFAQNDTRLALAL